MRYWSVDCCSAVAMRKVQQAAPSRIKLKFPPKISIITGGSRVLLHTQNTFSHKTNAKSSPGDDVGKQTNLQNRKIKLNITLLAVNDENEIFVQGFGHQASSISRKIRKMTKPGCNWKCEREKREQSQCNDDSRWSLLKSLRLFFVACSWPKNGRESCLPLLR